MRLAADDKDRRPRGSQARPGADPRAEGPALLALELMDPKRPEAEALVKNYLDNRESTSKAAA